MRSTIVVVEDARLSFGCVRARDLFTHEAATLLVYDAPRRHFCDISPRADDVFVCAHAHESVFVPLCRLDMRRWLLRRTALPSDLLAAYFDPFEHINRFRTLRHLW